MSWALCLLAVFCLRPVAAQQEVEFNYNGRVHVAGSPFSGTGYFKFSLVAGSPETTIWANDGAALDGSEPSSSIATTVTQGFFSVDIGDTSTPNMAALNPTLFNRDDKVYLRSWFSDGTHGFEQMHPDRRVVNPALLGSVSRVDTDIYVNPATGNDANSGLSPSEPKATIQSAWNALPNTIETTATIHLADGEYFAPAVLSGKTVVGYAAIHLLGNTESPEQVLLNGSGSTTATERGVDYFLHVQRQKNLLIQGAKIQLCAIRGIRVADFSLATIENCVCYRAPIEYTANSSGWIIDSEVSGPDRVGDGHGESICIQASNNCSLKLRNVYVHDAEYGLRSVGCSAITNFGATIDDCYWGINVQDGGQLYFAETGNDSYITYCHNGALCSSNGSMTGTTRLHISNSYDNDQLEWYGGVIVP